jgi:formate hydrogenlyase subunit 3/multisubunit Na+/H+ antiporter MnhD subunit
MSSLLLPWVVFLPLIAGAVAFVIPARAEKLREVFCVVVSGVVFLLGVVVLVGPEAAYREIPLGFVQGYLVDLRIDELNRFMVMFASLFGLLITVFSIGYMKGKSRLREYYPYLLITAGAANGALLANNWLGLVAFWGLVLVTMFLLTTIGSSDVSPARVMASAAKSMIILMASDTALIVGIGLLFAQTGSLTISETSLAASGAVPMAAFVLIAVGALSKAGAMPMHSWIPDMAEAAPTSVMALLPASVDKLLGIYLLARLVLSVFQVNLALNLLLMVIGAVTIVAAVVMAMVQHDLRKLLSFHAVSQVGYMVLGIGTGTPIGVAGGLFHMLNHAIYKAGLFLTAGAVEKKAGTMDLAALGGLARFMPFTFGTFAICALAISGIPPLNGFMSKWMVYQGIVEAGVDRYWVFLVAAMFGSALTLASFVKVAHAVFLGDSPRGMSGVVEVGPSMRFAPAVLATLCVVFGIAAQVPLQHFIGPAVGMQFPAFPDAMSFGGIWSPTVGAALLLLSLLIGYFVYLASRTRPVRIAPVYIGGETAGEGTSDSLSTRYGRNRETSDTRVLGTEFYDTIRNLPGLNVLYDKGGSGAFDIQRVGRIVHPIGRVLSAAHSGRLSSYVSWVVWGVLILLVVVSVS